MQIYKCHYCPKELAVPTNVINHKVVCAGCMKSVFDIETDDEDVLPTRAERAVVEPDENTAKPAILSPSN